MLVSTCVDELWLWLALMLLYWLWLLVAVLFEPEDVLDCLGVDVGWGRFKEEEGIRRGKALRACDDEGDAAEVKVALRPYVVNVPLWD